MDVVFEFLKEEDLKETYDLCMGSFGENFSFDDIRQTFDLCKDDLHYFFIVGKVNGKIVAYTTMVIFHNLFDGPEPIATLWYVCVDKNYRRKGIAKKMFEKIEAIANGKYCEIIYFTSLCSNCDAHKFYRSVGYSDQKEKAFVKWEK